MYCFVNFTFCLWCCLWNFSEHFVLTINRNMLNVTLTPFESYILIPIMAEYSLLWYLRLLEICQCTWRGLYTLTCLPIIPHLISLLFLKISGLCFFGSMIIKPILTFLLVFFLLKIIYIFLNTDSFFGSKTYLANKQQKYKIIKNIKKH